MRALPGHGCRGRARSFHYISSRLARATSKTGPAPPEPPARSWVLSGMVWACRAAPAGPRPGGERPVRPSVPSVRAQRSPPCISGRGWPWSRGASTPRGPCSTPSRRYSGVAATLGLRRCYGLQRSHGSRRSHDPMRSADPIGCGDPIGAATTRAAAIPWVAPISCVAAMAAAVLSVAVWRFGAALVAAPPRMLARVTGAGWWLLVEWAGERASGRARRRPRVLFP